MQRSLTGKDLHRLVRVSHVNTLFIDNNAPSKKEFFFWWLKSNVGEEV